MPIEFVLYRNLAVCIAIVAALCFLAVQLCREWVKRDLRDRICRPIRVRWRPFAYRTDRLTCCFQVVYAGFHGRVHRAVCWTCWHRPSVTWVSDIVVEEASDPVE